jgi:hypothetical protein
MEKVATPRPSTRQVPPTIRGTKIPEVRVTGNFKGWAKGGLRVRPNRKGEWLILLTREPGDDQYRILIEGELLIDGNWIDQESNGRMANAFRAEDCILKVT